MEPVRAAAGLAATTLVLATVWEVGAATVYVPTPPEPETTPVTTVPGSTPGPETGVPTAIVPSVAALTERVLPEIDATMTGAAAAIVVLATVCETLTVYVPAPPLPVPTAVTTVPAAMPGPTIEEPTERVPDATELTVSVLPDMEPERAATGVAAVTAVLATV
jgi:hypothetical protein